MTSTSIGHPNGVEASAIAKVRKRILPYFFVLYIVAFLDRVNVGFAALTMNKNLGITAQQFGLLAGIFFLVGSIRKSTGSMYWGLAFVGISLLISAALVLALPKRLGAKPVEIKPATGGKARRRESRCGRSDEY